MAEPRTNSNSPVSLIRVGFKVQDIASVRVKDTDLIVILKNGQRVTLRDGAMRAMIDPELRIATPDGEILATDLLKEVGSVKVDDLTQATVVTTEPDPAGVGLKGFAGSVSDANGPAVSELTKQAADTNASLREFIETQRLQNEALARNYELLSEKLAQMSANPAAQLAQAPQKSGFFANLNPAWGALGALGVLGAAGGAASAATTVVQASEVLNLVGNIVLGPVLSGNQLRVVAYDRNGTVLGTDESVDPGGSYSIAIRGGYTGAMVIKVFDDETGVDYRDEATPTSAGKSLGSASIRALTVGQGTGTQTVHLNPLTELAAIKAGSASGSVTYSGTADNIATTGKAIANLLLTSTEAAGKSITDIAAVATINGDGTANAGANTVGQLLDMISSVESTAGMSTSQTVTALSQQVAVSGSTATYVDSSINNTPTLKAALLLSPPKVTGLTLSTDTGVSTTDLITSAGTGQTVAVSMSRTVTTGQTIALSSDGGTTWGTAVAGNGTNQVAFSGVTLASGSQALQFRITTVSTGIVNPMVGDTGVNITTTLDQSAPGAPALGALAMSTDPGSDFITNQATQNITGTLTTTLNSTDRLYGSVDGGATFTLITNRTVLGTNTEFTWAAVNLVNQTAGVTKSLVFRVVDVAGNVGANSTAVPYTLDTAAPTQTVGNFALSNDNGAPGYFITGTVSQTISARLNVGLNVSTTNGETLYGSTDGGASWTNLNAFVIDRSSGGVNISWTGANLVLGSNSIVFKVVDVAGNTSGLSSQTYTLLAAPAVPLLTLSTDSADGNTVNNDGITRFGTVNVSNLENGSTWQYSINGGTSWTAGTGSSFLLGVGTYAVGAIRVRQTNVAGVTSQEDFNLSVIMVDLSAATPSVTLAQDLGLSGGDGITNDGTITVSGLESGASWRYSTNGGSTWTTGTGSSFVLAGASGTGTTYSTGQIRVEQTDLAGNVSSAGTNPGAYTIKTGTPSYTLTNIDLSADTGTLNGVFSSNASSQSNDFITNSASQTITATLGSTLSFGDRLFGSTDGGATWTNITSKVTGTAVSWNGATLVAGSNSIAFKLQDNAGNDSTTATQSYLLDTTAPTKTLVAGLVMGNDTGSFGSDGITSSNGVFGSPQSFSAELSSALVTTGSNAETIWASVNAESSTPSWINVSANLNGTTSLNWNLLDTGTTLLEGQHTLALKVTDVAGNSTVLGTLAYELDTTAPTATVSNATYVGSYQNTFASSRTLSLTGTNFNTILNGSENSTTDVKARLDWSKLSYDYDSNNTGVLDAGFTISDIESAYVTNNSTLTIKLTAAKAAALESFGNGADYFGADSNANATYWTVGAGASKGNQADGIDILSGFFKDQFGHTSSVSANDVSISYATPVTSISLGTYGNLIAGAVVAVNTGTLAAPTWVNKTFYYWDLSGNGTNTDVQANGSSYASDKMNHNFLDGLFYRNSSFTGGTMGADTTSASFNSTDFRYGDLTAFNNYKLALPTGAGASYPLGDGYVAANFEGNQLSDLTAIWDQYNTTMATAGPSGWLADRYWTATRTSAENHIMFSSSGGYQYQGRDDATNLNAVTLQVL